MKIEDYKKEYKLTDEHIEVLKCFDCYFEGYFNTRIEEVQSQTKFTKYKIRKLLKELRKKDLVDFTYCRNEEDGMLGGSCYYHEDYDLAEKFGLV